MNVPIWRRADNVREALNFGTTLTTRFWMALAMILYGAGFFMNQATWLASPTFATLNGLVDLRWWGWVFLAGGLAGMWRVWSPRSWPICAWVVNIFIFLIWFATMIIRIWNGGDTYNWGSVVSTHTAWTVMAAWCLTRTEATARDKETA